MTKSFLYSLDIDNDKKPALASLLFNNFLIGFKPKADGSDHLPTSDRERHVKALSTDPILRLL